jgi:hypothetical protein
MCPLRRSSPSLLALALTLCATAALLAAPAVPAGPRPSELDWLPADTEMVFTINVRQLVDSPLFKKHALAHVRSALKEHEQLRDVLEDLGFDPLKDLDRITAGSPGGKARDRGLLIARGRFDVARFRKKAEEAARDHPDVLKVQKVRAPGGALTVWEVTLPTRDESIYVALADRTTLLASPGKDYVVEALKAARLARRGVLKNKNFQALLEKMDSKQSVSVAVLGKALARGLDSDIIPKVVKDTVAQIEAIGGGITFAEDIRLEVAVTADSPADARALRERADRGLKTALAALALLSGDSGELGALLEFLKTVRVTSRGKVVLFKARLSADAIEDALNKDE